MKEPVRRILRSVAILGLRPRSQPWQLSSDARCLVIAPHQDDEAFGCAGLILAQQTRGTPVDIVYLIDRSGSHPGHPRFAPAEIARIRHQEAVNAMQQLSVPSASLHFLDAPDGTLARLTPAAMADLTRRLADLIDLLRPTALFLPCEADRSSEPTAAFALARQALLLATLQPRILEYPIGARWRPQPLLRLGRKRHRVGGSRCPTPRPLRARYSTCTFPKPAPPLRGKNPYYPASSSTVSNPGRNFSSSAEPEPSNGTTGERGI